MDAASPFKLSSKQCSACNVTFESDDVRRAHSKTQWHVENLRRRVTGFPPLEASAFSAPTAAGSQTGAPDSKQDVSSDESDDAPTQEEAPSFVAENCLFCNRASDSFDDSILHMQKSHGLFINDLDHLVVDPETLFCYLHQVVFDYHECLYCHSQRRTAEAAQQHMVGKGHCKIDIQHPDSEYRDFFDFDTGNSSDEGTSAEPGSSSTAKVISPIPSRDSVRLPSGKTVTSRTAAQASQESHARHFPRSPVPSSANPLPVPSPETADPTPLDAPSSSSSAQIMLRSEKREAALSDQLAHLSVGDRQSLAHLAPSEQRALLAAQKKQVDKAQRAELRRRSRVELLGNRTLMEHFISETPARRLKYSWC
ncbi:C2H2 type zinc-finger-domain-containing protein [Lasiosphaeria miniovina]|uniref:C2H2 type zinc-finger-domain-containing protein n=1 Tax=Lasiosphaeria miniovina TaxID=1954250 RepID=A0AA40EDB5_9PEZI|nr:C2H2 type zinc-finger-domain-containing protein [Lasiosphaeria miniovina]KAK0733236.1 C2H2 type zinc-finger-domain-containing protein [Lasiosphaeria miniovina]